MSIARYKVGPRIAAAAKLGDTIYVAGTGRRRRQARREEAGPRRSCGRSIEALAHFEQQQVEDRLGECLGVGTSGTTTP